ncbi:hypothetical protein ABD76_27995 [Paenibacillus dendritiformis]|uniref:hypothetical protein n=1 Tax=Paenibacillus dendritiformis TaxID=130049 RepID=UPI0018CF3B11|nr:hypothetical protein [Paenibacillus dendritiformis]MBG9796066.1 hypothetical protein [Paenibacillus dendritiformis]
MGMTRESILNDLLSAAMEHENMLWVLAALKLAGKPVQKEQLKTVTNMLYKKVNPNAEQVPIRSRHLLDEVAAMLEGAALVHVTEVAKSKRYTVSRLGEELLEFRQEQMRRKHKEGRK